MSRAFVKEQESVDELPDRLISEHANLVTPEGLAQIEAEVQHFDDAHAAAQIAGDLSLVAATARDLATGARASPLPRWCRRRRMPTMCSSARP